MNSCKLNVHVYKQSLNESFKLTMQMKFLKITKTHIQTLMLNKHNY